MMGLPEETEEKWKKLLDDGPLKAPLGVDSATCAKLLANQEIHMNSHRKNFGKSIRERYRRIAASRFFKEAYEGKSIGDIMEIEE